MEAVTREEEKGKNGDSQVKQKNNIGEVSREMEERVIQGSSINEVEGGIDLGQKEDDRSKLLLSCKRRVFLSLKIKQLIFYRSQLFDSGRGSAQNET